MWQIVCNLVKEEDAPTMVEYGLMIALIALIALVAVGGIAAFVQAVAPLFTIPAGTL